ncbi:MAG: ribosome-recycling factor [Metamycoplasmataceae bacterium]
MDFDFLKLELEEENKLVLEWFKKQLTKITVSGANPELFKHLQIKYFDALSPLIDLCSITRADNQQLIIKPYEKSLVSSIVSVIEKQNYSLSIQDEGDKIRIIFPALTQQRRIEETKKIAKLKEEGKIKIRNLRQAFMKQIKDNKEISEDLSKEYQNKIQVIIDSEIKKIDLLSDEKEKDLLKL